MNSKSSRHRKWSPIRQGLFIVIIAPIIAGLWFLAFYVLNHDTTPSNQVNANKQQIVDAGTPPTEQNIIKLVNIERQKAGVSSLVVHPSLTKSAQLKADDMWNRGYRDHYIPGTDQIYTDEMKLYVHPLCSYSSENYAYYDIGITAEIAIDLWLESQPHKEAMLDPQYTYTGIGVSNDSIVVEHFCVAR